MKKVLVLLGLLFVVSCYQDDIIEVYPNQIIPQNLEIYDKSGIKLENYIVEEEVRINVKLLTTSTYRIKILDIGNTIISQEKIEANEGDNLLKVYVKALPQSSFTIIVEDIDGNEVGQSIFSKK